MIGVAAGVDPWVLVAAACAALAVLARSPRRLVGELRGAPVLALVPVVGLTAWVLADRGLAVPAVLLGSAAVLGHRALRSRRRRLRAEEVAGQVLHGCEGLAADLSAGLTPEAVLARAARDWPLLAPVSLAHGLGASVPEALRGVAADTPGAADLRVVAAAWEVGRESGPGLAAGLEQVAGSLRADRATARVVAAELASARATARLIAVLPIGVLLLGSGSGADPWHFLLQTPPGWICLAAGLLLAGIGLAWLEALAAGVMR